MAYIGKSPAVGNFVKLDAISTSSTNTYNLLNGGVAFVPESANHMLVSLNGVIQAPLSSFSISGSTITFIPASGTLSSSDSIDFIMVYGNVLDIGTPSDATVTNAKTNFVSTSSNAGLQIKGDGTTDGTLQLNCSQNSHGIKLKSPAHSASASYTLTFPTTDGNADQFLQSNGSGVLTWADAGGGGKVLQVVQGTKTDSTLSTSASYVATGLNVNITPSATSSKVLVMVSSYIDSNAGTVQLYTTIKRGSTDLDSSGTGGFQSAYNGGGRLRSATNMSILDSPNTTSQITYEMYMRNASGANIQVNSESGTVTIIAMEIGA